MPIAQPPASIPPNPISTAPNIDNKLEVAARPGRRDMNLRAGIEPRRPKYPIKAERLTDRQGFKFSPEKVAMFLKAAKGTG